MNSLVPYWVKRHHFSGTLVQSLHQFLSVLNSVEVDGVMWTQVEPTIFNGGEMNASCGVYLYSCGEKTVHILNGE